jgi:hypothetical protein
MALPVPALVTLCMSSSGGRRVVGYLSGTGEFYLVFHEEMSAVVSVVFVEAVADLLLLALVDAGHAPAHGVVDGGGLPRLPDHPDDAEAAVGSDVDHARAESVGPSF